jgi:hypothetical protein
MYQRRALFLPSSLRLSSRAAVTLAVAALLLGGSVSAQKPDDGERALNDADTRALRDLRKRLFTGELPANPKEKEHLEAIDVGARQSTYPLAWVDRQRTPGAIQKVYEAYEGDLAQLAKFRANNQVATARYARAVIKRALQVIQGGKAIAAINGTRVLARLVERQANRGGWQTEKEWTAEVLPRLADGNGELLATTLLDLVKDARQNDGVRYYALRGLRSLLALPPQGTPLLKKETEENIVRAALELVQRKVTFPGGAPQAEIDGYRVLRREAVGILAEVRSPALDAKTRPALALARVAGNDSRLSPPASLAERLEASIGLARMRAAPKDKDYQPDYAARQIAAFVVDFGREYNANREKRLALRLRSWKVDAARLGEALEAMKKEVKNDYVGKASTEALKELAAVERGNAANPGDPNNWLTTNPVPSKQLFASDEESDVKAGAAAPAFTSE